MKKKKNEEIVVVPKEKYVIPQINYDMKGIIRGRSRFQKSEMVSPIHGSNIVDRKHYVDNSGKLNIDYGYDYIRDDKHISDEEQIKRHGTKYYEFSFVNKQLSDDEKRGSDYNRQVEQEEVVEEKEENTLGSFFENPNEVKINEPFIPSDDMEEEKNIEDANEEENKFDEEKEFKIHISFDDEESYEYNTYSEALPKPEQTTIPSYLRNTLDEQNDNNTSKVMKIKEEKIDEIKYEEPKIVIKEDNIEEDKVEVVKQVKTEPVKVVPKKPRYDKYFIPYKELFPKSGDGDEDIPEWLEAKKEIINQSLQAFDIDGEVITYTKGPAFTRYEIMLAENVNVKKINSIYDNIQMKLKAKSLRIQAPIPGKDTVGIEVPNDTADIVKFGDILTDEYIKSNKNLTIALGKNIDGTPVFQNIIDMPHALIAGATKSGKSVCINTLLVSLLIKNSPEQLKLILVDPKKVELSFYNDLPHLATPVIDDAFIATEALKWAVDEMERRYDLLSMNRVRNIEDYNKKRITHPEMENLPFIVIVVDEFNDLVMQCGAEANDAIIRIAQKARAAGIHVILATQRPTVNVVNGTIKANITCRIAFRVAADADSRIILDENGAESLLGRGDMLIKNNGLPERVQGAYISDDEIANICDYICEKYEPDFLFTHDDLRKKSRQGSGGQAGGKEAPGEAEDTLYQVALYCIESGMCSINSIQQNFGFGFNRASRIVAILEERNIVSPKNGTKGREILVDTYELKKMFDDNF